MAGLSEDQGDKIISLLKSILDELQHIRHDSNNGAIIDELRELNTTADGISTVVDSIGRDVDKIERKP